MATHVLADGEDGSRAKRQKTTSSSGMDPRSNPYLAHMYENGDSYVNGYKNGDKGGSGPISDLKRHKTTSAQHQMKEDGPTNPFKPNSSLSERYFSILRTRRNLPVHAQRHVVASRVASFGC